MMTNEEFLERLTAVEALSMDENQMDSFTANYTTLLLDHSHDLKTAKNHKERDEWQARKTSLSNLIHRETAFVARLYAERIEEGTRQGGGN
jgi:hypothetical protein